VTASYVVVIGLGGVGSHAASMLLRSGVGRLLLVDFDQVYSMMTFFMSLFVFGLFSFIVFYTSTVCHLVSLAYAVFFFFFFFFYLLFFFNYQKKKKKKVFGTIPFVLDCLACGQSTYLLLSFSLFLLICTYLK
jgi:hypothetical protein